MMSLNEIKKSKGTDLEWIARGLEMLLKRPPDENGALVTVFTLTLTRVEARAIVDHIDEERAAKAILRGFLQNDELAFYPTAIEVLSPHGPDLEEWAKKAKIALKIEPNLNVINFADRIGGAPC